MLLPATLGSGNGCLDVPAIRYTRTTDGLNIAYQVVGEGPLDLVFVPQVISNVEIFWENPRWAGFMRELASFSRCSSSTVASSDFPTGRAAFLRSSSEWMT